MTDRYRSGSQLLCPACEAALREFRDRLVCDACDGIMLAKGKRLHRANLS